MHVLSIPAVLALEITAACNNRCPGCSNVYAARRDAAAPLPAGRWRELLAPFLDQVDQIRVTGGEPSLHPELFQILDDIMARGAQVTLFSNGRWAEPRRFVQRLRAQARPVGLLISLHGADAPSHEAFSGVPGSFAEALAAIRLAVEAGLVVSLSTVITRHNTGSLEAIADLAAGLGVRRIAFNRYIGPPLPAIEPLPAQLAEAIQRIDRLSRARAAVQYGIGVPQCFLPNDSEGCLAGVAYASIDPWGNLRPCAHSPTVIGSLCRSSLSELWHSPAMEAWRARMPAPCRACAAYSVCHGGCRAIQELRPDRRDPLRQAPLRDYAPPDEDIDLPASGRPRLAARLRPEPFGYVLLGRGQILPVRAEARPLLEACNGEPTFAQLGERFGEPGLQLLGELWAAGLLDLV